MYRILTLAIISLFSSISMSGDQFCDQASQFNLAEIEAGKWAVKRGSPTIIRLGREMVKYHSLAQSELHALVQEEGLTLSAAPDTEHKKALSRLRNLSGKSFDSAYISIQFHYYNQAISIFTEESKTGKDPDLRAYAGKHLPKLQMHLQMFEGQRPGMKISMDSAHKK